MCTLVWPGVSGEKCAGFRGKHSLRDIHPLMLIPVQGASLITPKCPCRVGVSRLATSHSFHSACASKQILMAAPVPCPFTASALPDKALAGGFGGPKLGLLQHTCTLTSSWAWPVYPAKYSGCCIQTVVFELSIFCSFLPHPTPWQGVTYSSSFTLRSTGFV